MPPVDPADFEALSKRIDEFVAKSRPKPLNVIPPDPITITVTTVPVVITYPSPTISGGRHPYQIQYNPPSGTALPLGRTDVGISVTSADGQNMNVSFSIFVQQQVPPLNILTTSLPTPQIGVAYNQPISVSGGTPPYTFSISSGALPTGLSINTSTGTISGTPTTAGTFNFTVRVVDVAG